MNCLENTVKLSVHVGKPGQYTKCDPLNGGRVEAGGRAEAGRSERGLSFRTRISSPW